MLRAEQREAAHAYIALRNETAMWKSIALDAAQVARDFEKVADLARGPVLVRDAA